MKHMLVAIDIGGTNTRVGASKNGRTFFAIEKFKTPKKLEDGIRQIAAHIQRFDVRAREGSISKYPKIAIAMPGSFDITTKKSLHLANLPGWNHKSIIRALTVKFHTKILLINDADAAGIGEARRGAGLGYHKVSYFTISTGIGGARIINGIIDPKTPHYEPGHYTLVRGGRACGCGRRGCFEAYGSGMGFFKTYGVRTENCKDQNIWNEYAQTLGQGILKTLPHPLPDIIIIGGGVSHVGATLFTPLKAYIKKNLHTNNPPPIVPSKLGDASGLYGCLEILK